MRKIIILIPLFILSHFSFSQLGKEDLNVIKELKEQKLYVYIVLEEDKYLLPTRKKDELNYADIIEKVWDFCDIEFIDKAKYKSLKKDKKTFILTNAVPASNPGMAMSTATYNNNPLSGNKIGNQKHSSNVNRVVRKELITLTQGFPSHSVLKKKQQIFSLETTITRLKTYKGVDIDNLTNEQLVREISMINNYLNDCITHNTASFDEVSKQNAPLLKGKDLIFLRAYLKKIDNTDFKKITTFNGRVITAKELGQQFSEEKIAEAIGKEFYLMMYSDGAYYFITIIGPNNKICFIKRGSFKFNEKDLTQLNSNIGG